MLLRCCGNAVTKPMSSSIEVLKERRAVEWGLYDCVTNRHALLIARFYGDAL